MASLSLDSYYCLYDHFLDHYWISVMKLWNNLLWFDSQQSSLQLIILPNVSNMGIVNTKQVDLLSYKWVSHWKPYTSYAHVYKTINFVKVIGELLSSQAINVPCKLCICSRTKHQIISQFSFQHLFFKTALKPIHSTLAVQFRYGCQKIVEKRSSTNVIRMAQVQELTKMKVAISL